MCLAIPGRVVEVEGIRAGKENGPLMGKVDFGGIQKNVCLDWTPDVNVGEYVIVHVGFAISKVNEEEALETLRMLEEMGELQADLGPPANPSL